MRFPPQPAPAMDWEMVRLQGVNLEGGQSLEGVTLGGAQG
jgi:hypothetical protein